MNARRASVAGWVLLVLAALAYVATSLSISADFSAFLPKGQNEAQRILNRELRDGLASRLLLIELSHDDPHSLARISRVMARTLRADPAIRYVANGEATLDAPDLAFIERHRYLLSDRIDAAHFDTAQLRAALEERLEGLAGGGGALEKRWLASDPTGETLHVLAQLAPATQPERSEGVWFARGKDAALLIAETRAAGWDIEGQQRAIALLRAAFDGAREGGAAQMRFSSPGTMAVLSRSLIATEATRLSLVSTALILGILVWVYRSLPMVLVCFLPAATGLLAGICAVSAWFGSVHGITLGFGATLLGEAVDYPTFLLTQLRAGESVSAARTRLGPTLRMAILTTACGSLSLLLADFPGLAQLGLMTMVGILVAGAMTYWVLPLWVPAAMVRVPAVEMRVPVEGPRLHPWLRQGLVIALVAIVAALAWNRPWFDDDVAGMNPLPASLRGQDRELREALHAPDVRFLLVISGETQEDVLRRTEELRPQLRQWIAKAALRGYDLVTDVLPSRATQAARQAALPEDAPLRAHLEAALAGLPFRPGVFAPFVEAVARARADPPLTLEAMGGTALGFKAGSLLRHDGGEGNDGWQVVVPLRGVANPGVIANAVAQSAAAPAAPGAARVRWIDLRGESAGMMTAYRQQASLYAGLGAVLIFAVLAFGLHSAGSALRLMMPVALAILLTACTLVAWGHPLSVLHLVALLLVLGVGINYALFVMRAVVARDDAARTLRTLAVVSATTLCAFGVLALSGISVLQVIGATVSIGVVYSLFLCALLLLRRDPA
jgi:predicted exporter